MKIHFTPQKGTLFVTFRTTLAVFVIGTFFIIDKGSKQPHLIVELVSCVLFFLVVQ